MSELEIDRRCSACGVSVRPHAVFCPQCGNPISGRGENSTSASSSETIAAETAPTQDLNALPAQPGRRIAEDGVRARVERFRRVSSVVIDQAAYDPSLRFLLVAAGLFILFLVLLILSKVLG
jgi:predicted RNA-binding Zn-ribbon protein involved in translation (DUF1610 family)